MLERGEPLPAEMRRGHAIGMPEDCAPLVVFLASDAASEITGQAIGLGGDRLTLSPIRPPSRRFTVTVAGMPSRSRQAWEATLAEKRQIPPPPPAPLELDGPPLHDD